MSRYDWQGGPRNKGHISPLRDWERVVGQIERGEVRVGPEAAREIARRIEAQGGFWGPRKEEKEERKEITMEERDKWQWTQEELCAEAVRRFGKDPMKWAFQCPNCQDVATGDDFRKALADNPRTGRDGEPLHVSAIVGQECIGRTLGALKKSITWDGRGCDWAAYGLFSGPWEITMPDGHTAWGFPLAQAA